MRIVILLNCYIAKLLYFKRRFSDLTIKRSNTGFTLIEFLVVAGILSLVVGSTTLFLTSVLKGANQTNITAEIKQNGQEVLDSLERQIRGARDAAGLGVSQDHLMIIRDGANPLHIKCFSKSSEQNTRIATAVSKDLEPADTNFTSISNDDPRTGVSIEDCVLQVVPADFSQGRPAPAIVSIEFTAKQAQNAPTKAEFEAQAQFKTTISLRTY